MGWLLKISRCAADGHSMSGRRCAARVRAVASLLATGVVLSTVAPTVVTTAGAEREVAAGPAAAAGRSVDGAAPRAPSAPIVIDGHGNGHGIGMSQWGAYGYAVDHGWSATQILDHYYGGTVGATVGADAGTITVRLMSLDDVQTAVVHDRGQLVVDGAGGGPWSSVVARESQPGRYTVWARSDAGVCPAAADPLTSGWSIVASNLTVVTIRPAADTSASADYGDLAAVCEPSGKVRSYRGAIRAVNGTAGENRTVNEVPLEQYLRPIVATEMSASWASKGDGRGAQALQAQAVAARTYALAEKRYSYAVTCDQVCQSYPGAAWRSAVGGAYQRVEQVATDAAVVATAGVVRRVGSTSGPVAYTMFSSSSGGWTAASTLPFPAVEDLGDAVAANPYHSWVATVAASAVEAAWPAIGAFVTATVTARSGGGDWGGRVVSIRVAGTAGVVEVSGDRFRRALGLRSDWFSLRNGVDTSGGATGGTGGTSGTTGAGTAGTPSIDPCAGQVAPSATRTAIDVPPARFQTVDPVRLLDTRETGRPLGRTCTIVVDPGLADGATAVAVNITTVDAVADGFLTAYPCGVERPFTATEQPLAGKIVGGTAIVPLGADGTFCLYANVATDVVVDLFGVYSTAATDRFEPVDAQRRYDSRTAGSRPTPGTTVAVDVASGVGGGGPVTAVSLTLHATDALAGGFVVAWPCGRARPWVSAANVASGGSVTNHLEVAVGDGGQVCFSTSQPMHLTVDLAGWFGPAATTDFHAVTPFRLVDTREGHGWPSISSRSVVRPLTVAGGGAVPEVGVRAVAAQFTAVDATSAGYLALDGCRSTTPELSVLRFPATRNVAGLVTGGVSADGRWCAVTSATTHLVVDVTGWFG